jgi:plasmid stabilization system protein ParE
MAEIKWTVEAEKWLNEIHKYIAKDNPASADRVVSEIYEKVQLLTDFPEIGYKYGAEPEGDIRILLYGHYRIAYLIQKQGDIVILGVFHGALNMDKYFR